MKLFVNSFLLAIALNVHCVYAQLVAAVQTIQNNYDLMGGVAVSFCNTGVIEAVPFGTANINGAIPVTNETVFRVASVSKLVTAIGIMQQVEQGQIVLDENIETYLGYAVRNPAWPNHAITVRMLLNHTSTIIDGNTYSSFLTATYNNNPIPPISSLVNNAGSYYSTSLFTQHQPGSYFNYSNLNYGILGTVLEAVTGQRFDNYFQANLFAPLSLNAAFNVNHLDDIGDVAVLYRKIGGVWTAQADNFMGQQPVWTNLGSYVPGTNGLRFAPQGGLRISGVDLATLMTLFLNQGAVGAVQVLQPGSVNAMTANEWTFNGSNGNNYYGLFRSWGLGVHRITSTPNNDVVLPQSSVMFGHAGEAYGLVSDAYVDTARNAGIIFITNGSGSGYNVNLQSAFYTVEADVFAAVETHTDFSTCDATASEGTPAITPTVEVFPNPAANRLGIAGCNGLMRISDATGRLLLSASCPPSGWIDVSDFCPGLYILHNGNTARTFSVIR